MAFERVKGSANSASGDMIGKILAPFGYFGAQLLFYLIGLDGKNFIGGLWTEPFCVLRGTFAG